MKRKLVFLLIAAFGMLSVVAQDNDRIFKRFKGDISMGYAAPINSNSNGGVLFSMEPKFAVIDKLAVGLRIEGAITARFTGTEINGDPEVEDAKLYGSYLATIDYYFTNNYSFRPFVGGGTGVFGLASDEFDDFDNFDEDDVSLKFGGMLRIGAEVKHFRFGVEFNIIPNTNLVNDLGDNLGRNKNSYFGIKAGVCIGGGPRR